MDSKQGAAKVALIIGLIMLGLALAGWFGMQYAKQSIENFNPVGVELKSTNTQVVRSVRMEEQVVLMSLGIQGLTEEKRNSTVLGKDIPGTGRSVFIQYSYRAKLGIEGDEVRVEQTGDKQYLVTIPEFVFLGHSDEDFKTVVEDNGMLSWVTPDIDTAAVITKVLNDEAKQQHVDDNHALLEDQARNFYTGIIHGIDPEIEVDFKFRAAA